MAFLGFGKKKEEIKKEQAENEQSNNCCCGGDCTPQSMDEADETGKNDGSSKNDESVKNNESVKNDESPKNDESSKNDKSVKVLGSGCTKCNQLEANVKKALEQLGMDTTIEHVTDFSQIAAYGVMTTPALVVDGKVVAYGKVLSVEDSVKILEKVR